LDEPTAVLTPQEVENLFERLNTLWRLGKTILLISHKLREVLRFTQTVTVMRRGTVVENTQTRNLNEDSLAEKIVGRKMGSLPGRQKVKLGSPILTLKNLTVRRLHQGGLCGIDLQVSPGEVVGIAGIEGNGQQEIVEVLAKVNRSFSGEVIFAGVPIENKKSYALKQSGLSVVPPDRHREGIILEFSVQENFILGHHREPRFTSKHCLWKERICSATLPELKLFDVRPLDPFLPIRALSGGNQQKVVMAREIAAGIKFLLAAHPTRGVDIGATQFLHSRLLGLRDQGVGILLISSELEEILTLADRILVLFEGRITGEVLREKADEHVIGRWMTGGRA
jgi:ABC-type uncharacterized transport system ATPase subunit